MHLVDWLRQPWPWYVSGPLIGLMVPALLILGNRTFGISSSLRHICAICIPGKIPFFQYDWRKESWSLLFVGGIVAGAFLAAQFLNNPNPIRIDPRLASELNGYGVRDLTSQVPLDLFQWPALLTLRGWLLMGLGGFLVGFGTRYAGGCTSGHAITGLSTLQLPSLIATISFMAGGFITSNLLLPYILKL